MRRILHNPVALIFSAIAVGAVLNMLLFEPLKRRTPNFDLYHKATGVIGGLPFIHVLYSMHNVTPALAAFISYCAIGAGAVVGRVIRSLAGGGE